MSKRSLKKYLQELTKTQLEEQVMELYLKFKDVKTYYDFAFNPKEDKLITEAKFKISKEYFPPGKRRPKARRSVAQKHIKHFMQIGLESGLLGDLMLYNIEVAQSYNVAKPQKAEAFYRSVANSFAQALDYMDLHGLLSQFEPRVKKIVEEADRQEWYNLDFFYARLDELY